MKEKESSFPRDKEPKILLVSILIGFLAGLVTLLYRLVLTQAEHFAFSAYAWGKESPLNIVCVFVGLAFLAVIVGFLCTKHKLIGGSGIPQLKAQMMGYIKNTWFGTLWAKFVAGSIACLGGLSLGREGPSIQLGACVAEGIANKVTKSQSQRRLYIASGASAGLASAFHAPLAGTMFVIEEIFGYISPLVLLSSMTAAVVGDMVSSTIFGMEPVFTFHVVEKIPLHFYWVLIILGALMGLFGAIYNILTLKAQAIYKKLKDVRIRIFIAFMFAGVFGLLFPYVLGGGHAAIEELHFDTTFWLLIAIFGFKFLFSLISFGSGAAGGIFFPLLVLGASLGAIFAKLSINVLGLDPSLFDNLVIMAMVGYFTAIVRAPITGVVLIMEMTGSFSQFVPLILTSIVAYAVTNALGVKPIYDSLMENLLKSNKMKDEVQHSPQIFVTVVVQDGARVEGMAIRDLSLPEKCLLIAIERGEEKIIPKGDTVIKAGDKISVLTDLAHEVDVRENAQDMCCV